MGDSGTPLYGFGMYFAEHITKADEYSKPVGQSTIVADVPARDDLFCVLLCRLVGGRVKVVTTNEFEATKLKMDVYDGPYHAVLGDRVSKLGKPYREVVIYDKDQCYPEYLLVYKRFYD